MQGCSVLGRVLLVTLWLPSIAIPPAAAARELSTRGDGSLPGAPPIAQRGRVLGQVDVPHDYYYREMYLPQATSGPSSMAWSPDGASLVYSMQGSLWAQPIDSVAAEQLTDGPGYHYQPDWSANGRFIAFVAYREDAINLMVLDVTTGRVDDLLANGAVNVEPRFSPDGSRLAFVSTADGGRWHLYVADFEAGRITEPRRITPDRASALPRYYYSRFDHYLSPTWSPDGTELLFVSNRGRIWGSGGFWRMEASPGSAPREVRYEETTWRARPDWSPDGNRVVYGSYLGRQWHQLWLMTDDGGDVLPLTYGEFDATGPRWSPEGTRIAYIANSAGNTALWVLEIPGGRRRRIRADERRYLRPAGRLAVEIVDDAGEPVPARVSVTGAAGRGWAPDDAWRHADDAFDRSERLYEHTYFHSPGASEMTLPEGRYTVEVTRGLEYRPLLRDVEVRADARRVERLPLERIADLGAEGWHGGDLHVHMNYGGAYRNGPAQLAFQAAAEDLDLVENLIVNKEQRIPDVAYFRPGLDPGSRADARIFHGQEFHTSFWGHSALIGLREGLLLPDYSAYVNTGLASPYPHNAAIFELARAQGAVVGYVHPFESEPDPVDRDIALTHELPVNVALGQVDYLEVVGFSDHRATARVWYRLLNCGFRIAAGAGTDAMANFASLRGPVGMNRVYVRTGAELDREGWLAGIREGRTFATNGPLLRFSIVSAPTGIEATAAAAQIGGEIRLPGGRHRIRARGSLRSIVAVDRLEIVGNGQVVAVLPISADGTSAEFDHEIEVERSGWYTLRAWSAGSRHPVLDIYPFATTSPIWVTVGGEPQRSPSDARYFAGWIDRLIAAADEHTSWNTAREREEVLDSFRRARAVFADLAASSPR